MTTEYTKNFQLALPDFRQGPWHDLVNNDLRKIDGLIYSAMSQGNVDVWANATHYTIGVSVMDSTDASVWINAIDHTSPVAPTTFAESRTANPTYWARLLTGFAPRGEWAQNTQYFSYDLVYDSGRGIMALCTAMHISTATGSILDDQAYWAFLLDMSDVGTVIASAVTYTNTSSHIPPTDVQAAIDYLEAQIVGLNNVNITQGNDITALKTTVNIDHNNAINTLVSQMAAVQSKDTTQDTTLTSLQSQITALAGRVTTLEGTPFFPVGTRMTFLQASPPTGWTAVNGWSDRAIRLYDNNAGGGTAGGALAWSVVLNRTTTDAHQLSVAEMPSHSHSYNNSNVGTALFGVTGGTDTIFPNIGDSAGTTGAIGNNTGHTHPMDMRLAYIGACVGQKS